jgi:serine protease Do
MTKYHVVAGTGGDLEVQLPDGRTFDATVKDYNSTLDLALLEVKATDLPAALVDDSSQLRVGELVFAVGHPWGQRDVVTAGIVSGVGEVSVPHTGRNAQYIRSDVKVAPGNSGGPLLNARGAVVGITAMIFGGDLTVAIPSQVAEKWVGGIPSRRVYLGIGVQPVELPAVPSQHSWAQPAGLMVVGVEPDGPASRAGLLVGDVLLAIGDKPVVDGESLRGVLAENAFNERVRLNLLRAGSLRELDIDLDSPETSA